MPSQPKHPPYQVRHDPDCQRLPCVAYRDGHRDGYRDGHDDGYREGYGQGYADGLAAGSVR